MSTFLSAAIAITLGATAWPACCCWRVLRGPTALDRVLALDLLYGIGMLSALVLGIRYASHVYFEAALLIALLGFVSSSAMAKFLLRGGDRMSVRTRAPACGDRPANSIRRPTTQAHVHTPDDRRPPE
jgi:multicomponent K+:H+ antiporter subunit F